jgi:hypothetical protein
MASWNTAGDLVVGGSGEVYVADSGATAPTNSTTAPNAAFYGMGYLSEDGVTISVAPEVTDFNVWQSRQPARRENQAQVITVSGQFAQWNEYTVPVCMGKGVLDATTGATGSFDFPADTDALAEHAVIADVVDGAEHHRFYFSRCNQTGTAEVQFNRQNLSVLPFEFSALAPSGGGSPGSYFTDSAGFTAGS